MRVQFNNEDKRVIEVLYYLLCNKIYNVNENENDIKTFINGYIWTNMFKAQPLLDILENENILNNSYFIPSNHEMLILLTHPNARIKIKYPAIKELTNGTNFKYTRKDIYHAQMREEVADRPVELVPKLKTPDAHETIYSFLLAIRYVADIVKEIRF